MQHVARVRDARSGRVDRRLLLLGAELVEEALRRVGRSALDRLEECGGLVRLVLRRGVIGLVALRVEQDEVAEEAAVGRVALLGRLRMQVCVVEEYVGRGLRTQVGTGVSEASRDRKAGEARAHQHMRREKERLMRPLPALEELLDGADALRDVGRGPRSPTTQLGERDGRRDLRLPLLRGVNLRVPVGGAVHGADVLDEEADVCVGVVDRELVLQREVVNAVSCSSRHVRRRRQEERRTSGTGTAQTSRTRRWYEICAQDGEHQLSVRRGARGERGPRGSPRQP